MSADRDTQASKICTSTVHVHSTGTIYSHTHLLLPEEWRHMAECEMTLSTRKFFISYLY